tara:strand:- start:221 stop:427 length:207 start_codon:yes stop_codon:yes gene_type:complete
MTKSELYEQINILERSHMGTLLERVKTLEAERNQMAAFVAFVFQDLPPESFATALREFNETVKGESNE